VGNGADNLTFSPRWIFLLVYYTDVAGYRQLLPPTLHEPPHGSSATTPNDCTLEVVLV
jgi:hypothetical protein